jgi:hypothetical protein
MRIQHVLAFAAAATLSVSAFAEPSFNVSPSNSANSVLVQGGAGANSLHRLTPAEAEHMKGAFRLEDGRILTVTNKRNKLFVELDGKSEELLPVGQNRFVARGSGTRVAFNQVPYADRVVLDMAR